MNELRVKQFKIPLHEIQLSFSRAGGPGGQNVNKVESRVTLRFNLMHSDSFPPTTKNFMLKKLQSRLTKEGDIVVSSQRSRSQIQNRVQCLQKLREILAQALHQPKKRKPTKPSKTAKERRIEQKKRRAKIKQQRQIPKWSD